MGNYIDKSVSVTGNADQLEKSWDALLADNCRLDGNGKGQRGQRRVLRGCYA